VEKKNTKVDLSFFIEQKGNYFLDIAFWQLVKVILSLSSISI